MNSQKAIRTNDIENVGLLRVIILSLKCLETSQLVTILKKQLNLWEFLTSDKWMGMEPEKLYVTIHPEDVEAYRLWHEDIGLEESRIIRIEGNFWDIGEGHQDLIPNSMM